MVFITRETLPPGPQNVRGSIADRLGVDPVTGTAIIDRDRLSTDLLPFADEFDARFSPQQRHAARAKREAQARAVELAAKKAAISTLQRKKIVPEGFAVVENPNDRAASISAGVSFGDGFVLIRTADLDAAVSAGFRVAPWPSHWQPDPKAEPPLNALPAAPLAIVRHPAGATTERGRDLGEGYRLVLVSDLKQLHSLGWEPTAWPAQ